MLVPGHGHVYDKLDLLEYRDAITIVRDRVQDLIEQGKTLAQVKAANPTLGYRSQYGTDSGPWTTDMFVEVVYNELAGEEREEMRRAPTSIAVIAGADGARCSRGASTRSAVAARRQPPPPAPTRRRADRPHRLLGVDRHAGLALAHGDARQRRLSGLPVDARSQQDRRRLGSGERRSRGRAVPIVRRARA